jgi:hypothetical protein
VRSIRNNILKNHSARDINNNRAIGEEHPTVDMALRRWELTRPTRKGI